MTMGRGWPVGVDDDDVLRSTDSERYLRCGKVLARPVPAIVVGQADVAFLGEEREQVVRGHAGQRVARVERHLEGRGANVGEEDVQVRRIQPGLLRRGIEQVVGVRGDELVDGPRARDEDRDARFAAATGAAHLLPGRRDRARIARQDRRIQPTDVDAQLERVGADHAEHIARAQARPRWRAAPWADSRRGSRGCASTARGPRGTPRAGWSAAARPRRAPWQRRWSGGRRAERRARCAATGRVARDGCPGADR